VDGTWVKGQLVAREDRERSFGWNPEDDGTRRKIFAGDELANFGLY
jgi:hypothetical protein